MKRAFKLWWLPAAGVLGCATAQLVGKTLPPVANVQGPKRVVLEPFFEDTRWQLRTHSETRTYYPYNPMYQPVSFTQTERWKEKPLYARTDVLAYEHRLAIEDLKKAAPKWEVLTTSAVNRVNGPLTLVRVIVGEKETLASDRSSHNVAFLFSWLAVPLLYELTPVHETERVHGQILIYRGTAEDLRSRLIKYDTQPDYAVNTRGLPRAQESFSIDLSYKEGIFAPEPPKNQLLVGAFSEQLSREIARFIASGPSYVTPPPEPVAVVSDGGTSDAGVTDGGAAAAGDAGTSTVDGGAAGDAGAMATDGGAGSSPDAGAALGSSSSDELTVYPTDAGGMAMSWTPSQADGGLSGDAGVASDAGSSADAGAASDAGASADAGVAGDAGTSSRKGHVTRRAAKHRGASDAGTRGVDGGASAH